MKICTVLYCTVQYSTVQYSTVQYSTVQYSTVQYSTVQYKTIGWDTTKLKPITVGPFNCSSTDLKAMLYQIFGTKISLSFFLQIHIFT